MSIENKPKNSIQQTRPNLVEGVRNGMGEEFLDMPPEIAAQFDTGDLEVSDPRIRASNKAMGRWRAGGGTGPQKTSD